MLDLVVSDNSVENFVSQAIFGHNSTWDHATSMGFLGKDGMLEAGVVFHNYNKAFARVEISGASIKRTWMTVHRLNIVADYVFNQLGCYTLIARHSLSNKAVRRIWITIGGREVLLPNVRGKGEHEIMHILTADEAKQSKFWRL